MNTPGCSRPSNYFHSSSSRPAGYGTKRFLGGPVVLLSLLVLVSSASAQIRLTPSTKSLQTASPGGTLSSSVTVSPARLTFASGPVGTRSAAQTVTLTNHQNTSLTVSAAVATGDFAVVSNTCGSSLSPGRSCTVGVTFTPTAVGVRTGTLTLPYRASGSPSVIPLSGAGNADGLISLVVTPANPSIFWGQTQQFTATGHFRGGSTQNLTASVVWGSSAPGVATINAAGLASSVSPGSTTIAATLVTATPLDLATGVTPGTPIINSPPTSPISGSTTLTVNAAFVSTGSMNTARVSPTATLLNDGMVLMAGGSTFSNDSAVPLASAELYNPTTGTFTPTGSLNTARYGHTATLLNNGMVLMAGGTGPCGYLGCLASAELYNPATGTFTPTGSLNTARWEHTATLLNNGMVLMAGGYNSSGYLASAELYSPTTGTFTPTGSLNTARYYCTATLLNNGMVLMAGGIGSSGSLSSAELYNPTTGTFSLSGSLNNARYYYTATLLNNAMVLMAGGENSSGYLPSAELYDPTTGAFSLTGSLNIDRALHTATLLNNGMVLMAGGYGSTNILASAELYNPATGTFSPSGSLNTARYDHTATLLNNGMVLTAGGYGPSNAVLASAELYEPATLTPPNLESIAITPATPTLSPGTTQQLIATGTFSGSSSTEQLASVTWSSSDTALAQISNDVTNPGTSLALPPGPTSPTNVTITAATGSVSGSAMLTVRPTGFVDTGSLNAARYIYTATLLYNGMVLIAGGFNPDSPNYLAEAEVYNPATGTFTLTGSLNTGRYEHTATLLSNGMVLIAGGENSSGPLSSAELYNPATGTFTATGSLNTARNQHTATLLNNGMVLIAGGYDSSGYLASAELYNPANGTFSYTTGSLNTARYLHTATLLNNGMVLVAGGYDSSGWLTSAELYNPAYGTFSYTTGSLNTARYLHTATLLNNGMVLIAGGGNSSAPAIASAELYNPATSTFTTTGNLSTPRYLQTATLLNNGMVLIAGGRNMGSNGFYPLASAELYNLATGTFTPASNLNTARWGHTATLLYNGMVLLAGGYDDPVGYLSSAELY